jgi:NAD(P)H-dependent FMN reductase
MSENPRILAFAGSAREGSFNRMLARVAVEGARAAGAEVTVIDLRDYPLPVFDQDLEAESGLPENARKLKELFLAHDGLLVACPEYNSSITPLLKNVIDWVSRKAAPDEPMLAAYSGKVAAILAASPGALGGLRSLRHVREILGNIGVLVLPQQQAVPKAHEAFAEDGTLKDGKLAARIEGLGAALAETLAKLR